MAGGAAIPTGALLLGAGGKDPEPQWTNVPVRRSVGTGLGAVLADVDSRLPAKGLVSSATYRDSDPITWTHEATHGVNSLVRNTLAPNGHQYNAAYCLGGRAAVLLEPRPVTLGEVARMVPAALRGRNTFNLYLVQQRQYWDKEPLYMLDEWSAYTNGADQWVQYKKAGRQHSSASELLFMAHFAIYSLCMAAAVDSSQRKGRLQYDDTQLKAFIQWQWNRMMNLFADGQPFTGVLNPISYYRIFAVEEPGANLRRWARDYFGTAWVSNVMRAAA
jgi:hypothetical protein